MKSWSESFAADVSARREAKRRPRIGFTSSYMTVDGPVPVSEAVKRFGAAAVFGGVA